MGNEELLEESEDSAQKGMLLSVVFSALAVALVGRTKGPKTGLAKHPARDLPLHLELLMHLAKMEGEKDLPDASVRCRQGWPATGPLTL